jgi:uncharacterized UPF0160 family protein
MAPTPYLHTCWSENFEQENPYQYKLNDIIATSAMEDSKEAIKDAKRLLQDKKLPKKTGIKTCIFIVSTTANMEEAKHCKQNPSKLSISY